MKRICRMCEEEEGRTVIVDGFWSAFHHVREFHFGYFMGTIIAVLAGLALGLTLHIFWR